MKHHSFLPVIALLFYTFLHHQPLFSQSNAIESSRDILFALTAASLGPTLIIHDEKSTWQFTKGVVVNQVVTFGL